jgi:hypothetical protein
MLVMTLLAIGGGCSDLRNCPEGRSEPIVIDHGATDKEAVTYESAPYDGPLDPFPAKTRLRFQHELGVVPLFVETFLSFEQHGTNGNGPGNISESAGNQTLIECVDAHVIEVLNDTCESSFFIRIVAAEEAPPSADGVDRSNRCSE